MKKILLALALMLMLTQTALADIRVTKRDVGANAALDKSVSNVLVLLQDGDRTDTLMIASVNSKTGRSVMTRLDCNLMVAVPEVGDVALGDVYALGDAKSRGLLAARTVNGLLGLNVSTYVALDIARLPELTQAVGALNVDFDAAEAEALGTWEGRNELAGDAVLDYVRLRLEGDSPARSRGYDALMQLLYQGLHSGNLKDMMGMGTKLLASLDTNLNPMAAVTMVSAVQAGTDRREVLLPAAEHVTAQAPLRADALAMQALIHAEIYE